MDHSNQGTGCRLDYITVSVKFILLHVGTFFIKQGVSTSSSPDSKAQLG